MSALLQPAVGYRRMRHEDLDAVCAIEQAIYAFPWSRGNFVDSMAAGYACTLVERDAVVAGYAILLLAAGESHLLNLSIAQSMQRQGLGRALLVNQIALARSQDARIMLLEVRPSNSAARALYAQAGFEQIAVRRGYYPDTTGREDALLLGLKL